MLEIKLFQSRNMFSLQFADAFFCFNREEVDFPGFVDCIYYGAPQELFLINGLGETISISNKK